jgi:hypothetical protein
MVEAVVLEVVSGAGAGVILERRRPTPRRLVRLQYVV